MKNIKKYVSLIETSIDELSARTKTKPNKVQMLLIFGIISLVTVIFVLMVS